MLQQRYSQQAFKIEVLYLLNLLGKTSYIQIYLSYKMSENIIASKE